MACPLNRCRRKCDRREMPAGMSRQVTVELGERDTDPPPGQPSKQRKGYLYLGWPVGRAGGRPAKKPTGLM